MRKMWEWRDKISFTHNCHCSTKIAQCSINLMRLQTLMVNPRWKKLVGELEEGMDKDKWAKQNSLVRKGDVVPHLALGSDGCTFWLLLCASIYGFEYRAIQYQDTTRENSSLPQTLVDEDMPMYTTLSGHQLLSHCLDCYTQIPTESINKMVRARCPKCIKGVK